MYKGKFEVLKFSSFFLVASLGFADENPTHIGYCKNVIEETEKEEGSMDQWELVKTFNIFDEKLLLSFIREGDYAHAGEEEAIDLIMSYFSKDKNWKVLDVACGLGGTAHYIQKHEWGLVTGFDIDEKAIQYAKAKYPNEIFFIADVSNISSHIKFPDFDLICIMNAFFCFPDQLNCLKELRKLAKPSTKLVIFEYTDLIRSDNFLANREKNISFNPIKPNEIDALVNEAGWETTTYVSLDKTFETWYENLLKKIESKKSEIDKRFGKNAANYAWEKYNLMYRRLKNKSIGGCLIILSPKK